MLINDASITGSLIVNASASLQNISLGGNIIPDETNLRNLGSTDKYFKEIYVSTGSINFVDGGSVVAVLSAGTITAIQSNTSSANSRLTTLESVSASLQSFTASISTTNTFTSSATARLNALETITSSNIARLNSIETITASNVARLNSIETITSSNIARLINLESITGSLATTGSNTFIGTQTITGSLFISSNLVVQGTSSLQNITASAVSIGTNLINLNTANPAIRYAGLVIGDSGSVEGSGSFLYDSVQDEMIFVHRGTSTVATSSVTLMGPQTFDNIGSETYPTLNIIQKGTGNEHLGDSCIFDNGTTTCIKNNLVAGVGNFSNCLTFGDWTTAANVLLSNKPNEQGGYIRAAVSTAEYPTYAFEDDRDTGVYRNGANSLGFATSGSARLTISNTGAATFSSTIAGTTLYGSTTVCSPIGLFSGCVGIGTNSPTGRLHLKAPSNDIVLRFEQQNDITSQYYFNIDSAVNGTLSLITNYLGGNVIGFSQNRSGFVGIGTTDPPEPLSVSFASHGLISQHRPSCSVGVGQNFYMKFNNVVGSPVSYAGIYSDIQANTNGAHSGRMILQVANNGSLSSAVTIANTGITTFSNTICSPIVARCASKWQLNGSVEGGNNACALVINIDNSRAVRVRGIVTGVSGQTMTSMGMYEAVVYRLGGGSGSESKRCAVLVDSNASPGNSQGIKIDVIGDTLYIQNKSSMSYAQSITAWAEIFYA